jgi:ectoine hydroxylase-related dioxygenase (phytanoyl-CoA dioxygenase family)
MPYSTEKRAQFQRDGVLAVGQVLPPPLVAEAKERIAALRAAGMMDNPATDPTREGIRLLGASAKDPWFWTIIRHPAVLAAAELALGPNIQFYQDNLFIKPPGNGAPTPWHQDNIWWHAKPPRMATLWLALDDCDAVNGGVQYVRGSHDQLLDGKLERLDPKGLRYFVLADEQVDQARLISYAVPAGHGVLHHCLTIHGAPPNDSPRWRHAYTIHLMAAGIHGAERPDQPLLRGQMPTTLATVA